MTSSKQLIQAAAGAGDIGAWDLSYAYYDDPLLWDVSSSSYYQSRSVAAQEDNPSGIFFKPDGTKMYMVGGNGDDVNEYSLSTAWNISTTSYVRNFSVASQDTVPNDVFFKPDGTKMYITGYAGTSIYEYDLSTAWNISTASYLQSFSVSAQETNPQGTFFKPDGTKMYVTGRASDLVSEYDLSTAWDVSSASHLQNFSVSTTVADPRAISFKDDGTKMYVLRFAGRVYEFDLSTAWDVSSSTYSQYFATASQSGTQQGLFFKPDGSAYYMVDQTNDSVFEYRLGGFDVSSQETQPKGMCFDNDGSRMYVTGSLNDTLYEYSLSTNYDLSTASYVRGFYIGSVEYNPQGVFFKPDGTTVYTCGSGSDSVNQWSLSTAWDVSTMSHVQDFSTRFNLPYENVPAEVFFKPDGTVMYVAGQSLVKVHAYTLSTAWDISTASYSTSFSLSGQITSITGLFFKDDGTKMYTVGYSSQDINEYDLSTAWDISTASYVQELTGISLPMSAVFNDKGTKLFYASYSTDKIYTYTLGPQ